MSQLDDIAARFAGISGAPVRPVSRQVTRADIERLARALGSSNPLYWDEDFARNTPFGSVIAPPTFLSTIRAPAPIDGNLGLPAVNGGNHFTYARPIRPGDVITGAASVTDVSMKESSKGRMLFLVKRTTYVNQSDQEVGTFEHTRIIRERASS